MQSAPTILANKLNFLLPNSYRRQGPLSEKTIASNMNENELAAFATRKSVYSRVVNYLFHPASESGWAKGQWFIRALGYDPNNPDHVKMLVSQITFNAEVAVFDKKSKWGNRYKQSFAIIGPNGRTIPGVRTTWQKDFDTSIIRLLTVVPPKRKRLVCLSNIRK